jgi:sigma-B regulation protein RsbU (phosphoserine phosphatase)
MKAKTNKPKHSQAHKTRPIIGLLMGELEEIYQAQVWPGVADVAYEQDVNLICFAGGSLDTPYKFDSQRNVIYNLVNPEMLDGLVLMSGSLGTHIKFDRLRNFCNRYRSLPLVSIALRLEGMPSLLIDNKKGMRELVMHLIEVHGYRRIAFIQGPQDNDEAEARFQAYTEVLAEHGLPPSRL